LERTSESREGYCKNCSRSTKRDNEYFCPMDYKLHHKDDKCSRNYLPQ